MHWKLKVHKWVENRVHLVTLIALLWKSKIQKNNAFGRKKISTAAENFWVTGQPVTGLQCQDEERPLLVPGLPSWWDGLGDGCCAPHMMAPTPAPLLWPPVWSQWSQWSQCMQYIRAQPANTRQLQTLQTIFTSQTPSVRSPSASSRLHSHTIVDNFYLCICTERGGTINLALEHMISLR